MKRLLAILMIVVVLCSMFMSMALAKDPVISPEQDNTDVDPTPSSPQTGGLPVGVYVAGAILLCAAAVFFLRKAVIA